MWNIVVQDTVSLRYLRPDDSWAYDVCAARSFPAVHVAAQHCIERKFDGARIVLGVLKDGRIDPMSKVILRVAPAGHHGAGAARAVSAAGFASSCAPPVFLPRSSLARMAARSALAAAGCPARPTLPGETTLAG
jgi:hypothetical protein